MTVHTDKLILQSNGRRVTYHDITQQVKAAVLASGVEQGICVVQSQHTTCSVIFEEYVHDRDFNGDEFLQTDMNRLLDRLIPRELTENADYRYPGQEHLACLLSLDHPDHPSDPAVLLNGDAHLRASIFGASESFVIHQRELMTGIVGSIYFVDFDQNRVRDRVCYIQIIGE